MSITNDIVTIAGNIGTDPMVNETRSGKAVINFRVATSSGYFDQRTGAWVEGNTNWYAVSAFGHLAEHAKASLHRGDAVIVAGRLRVREWEANGRKGIDVEIVADAIGHDLNRGTSAFARRQRTEPSAATAQTQEPEPSGAYAEDATGGPHADEERGWEAAGLKPVADRTADDSAEVGMQKEALSHA